MATANGQVRTRRRAMLPAKIEAAYRESEGKRGVNKTSRLDYAAGYDDGYQQALDDITEVFMTTVKRLRRELHVP